uniref:Uncharacterized protein n=1 Tax=Alexandrium catenella TaxID=2925 RepID=A0A7S1PRK6_ALECA
MAPAAAGREARRLRGRGVSFALVAATTAGLAAAAVFAVGFVAPGRPGNHLANLRGRGAAVPRHAEPPKKLWSLEVARTDHYVWRDKDTFVGIVADAGEWTVDLDSVRSAFDVAQDAGTAEVFTAPLYVVKDYVRELQSFGLMARAKQVEAEAVEGEEGTWRRRDWQELPPEMKEAAGMSRQEGENAGTRTIVVTRSDHAVFAGGRSAEGRFRAYVELASDAAKRFAPDEAELSVCFAKICGEAGRAPVLRSLTSDAAEAALAQLRKAGFEAEIEETAPASDS